MKKTGSIEGVIKNCMMALFVLTIAALSGSACAVSHPESATQAAIESNNEHDIVPPSVVEEKVFSLPIVMNDSVEEYIEQFTSEKSTFQMGLNNAMPYLERMKEIFRNEHVPEELVYVGMIESLFNPLAVSGARAAGLWQFMPKTASAFGLRNDKWVDERRDHLKSTRAAARYFKELHGRLGCWPLVMAAYNTGMGTVQRAISRTGSNDFWDLTQSGHLPKETKTYVPKVMAAVVIARDPEAYGFRVPETGPIRFDVIEIKKSMDLRVIARKINITVARIKSLNPEIKGMYTPPRGYLLKIPEGKKKIFITRSNGAVRQPRDPSRITIPSLAVTA